MYLKPMKYSLVSFAALLAFWLPLAACGGQPEAEGQDRPAAEQPQTPMEKPEEQNHNHQKHQESQKPQNSKDSAQEEKPSVKQGKGSLTGLADSHTVEIIVDGKPMAFQFDETLKPDVEAMKPDQQVEFKYEEKAIEGDASLKQLVLTEIAKAGSAK